MEEKEKIVAENVDGQTAEGRKWEEVSDPEKIDQFITEKLSKQISTLKGFGDIEPKIKFLSKKPEFMYVVKLDNHLDFPTDNGTLHANVDRQIELDFSIIQSKDGMLLIKPKLLKLALFERRSERITGIRGKVTATNFLVTKENIEDSNLYGIASQVLIQDIHKRVLSAEWNSRIIDSKDKEFEEELELCFRSGKIIYILDALRMISFKEEFVLDAKKAFEEELILEEKVSEYKKKKIYSLLFYPIVIPFGEKKPFVSLLATRDIAAVDPKILDLYKNVESIFLERIIDSNTHTLDVRQNVVNASLHGIALEITDSRLKKAIRIKPTITVDLNFKMQQPLRVSLEVKHIRDCGDYDLVGAEIMGFSGDVEGGRKYNSFLEFIQKV